MSVRSSPCRACPLTWTASAPECTTSAPRRWRSSMTRPTDHSFPGMDGGADHDHVVLTDAQPLVVTGRHQRQRGHRLALRSRRDHAHPSASFPASCPGCCVCEHLPKQAAMLDRFTIVRSVDAQHSNHEPNQGLPDRQPRRRPTNQPQRGNVSGDRLGGRQAPRSEPARTAALRGVSDLAHPHCPRRLPGPTV